MELALKTSIPQYHSKKGCDTVDEYMKLSEKTSDGFTVTSYTENLSEKARLEKDTELAKKAIKILRDYHTRIQGE